MLTAAASTTILGRLGHAADTPPNSTASAAPVGTASTATAASPITVTGYGTDPDMIKSYKPGDVWPLTLTADQRITAAALCAVIIPADATSPSAAELGVHDFIDEWISAPYPEQARDRPIIIDGLAWIEGTAQQRFNRHFAALTAAEKNTICDDICSKEKASPTHVPAAQFFARFRDLTAGGFYTTPQGMNDIGYVGNMPLITFDGPPPEVLKQLGLA